MIRVLLMFLIVSSSLYCQNNELLYGFKDIPQSLLINPGGKVLYKKHVGFPFFSGILVDASSKGLTVNSIFANDGVNINDKIRATIFNLNSNDHFSLHQKIDIVNFGFKLENKKDYLSLGAYEELDVFVNYPKDASILFYQGNTDGNGNILLNRPYNFDHINFTGELLAVYHIGLSREVNSKLTVGVRGKLYSGAFNIRSTNNEGTFSTVQSENNIYQHQFRNIRFRLLSSGIINRDSQSGSVQKRVIKNLIFSGNLGLGLDLGFTYHLKNDLTISGSILDVGFINYRKDIKRQELEGNHNIDGIGLLFPPTTNDDQLGYWEELLIDFDDNLNRQETKDSYISFRPIKINSSVSYQFGNTISQAERRRSNDCSKDFGMNNRKQNEIGAQLYTIFRPNQPQLALTAYYYRNIFNFLNAKITYTANSYSFNNIGLGLSTHIDSFNFYIMANNILSYNDISKSKQLLAQVGFNWIVD